MVVGGDSGWLTGTTGMWSKDAGEELSG